jgi:hypothetical protein
LAGKKASYMIIRLLIILSCVVVFINGCNSVISQHFGTHKLRAYTIEEALQNGIGDADFIELNGAWLPGDFVYKAAKNPNNPGVIIYPVLSAEQQQARDNGQPVKPGIIAWTTNFPSECVEAGNCILPEQLSLRGIVRDLPKDRRAAYLLQAKGYQISENALLIEHGRSPLAWHWNALMMMGAVLAILLVEAYNQRKLKSQDRT